MSEKLDLMPKFRTEGPRNKVRVFLQCSLCDADIRELGMDEEIDVRRAYLCDKCDPSGKIIVPNPPMVKS